MTASRRRVEAAARALAEQWCDNPAQMVEAMKVTMRDAATLERRGLLADPPHNGSSRT